MSPLDIIARLERSPAAWVCIRREAADEIRKLRKENTALLDELKIAAWRFERLATGEHEGGKQVYAEAIAQEMRKWK